MKPSKSKFTLAPVLALLPLILPFPRNVRAQNSVRPTAFRHFAMEGPGTCANSLPMTHEIKAAIASDRGISDALRDNNLSVDEMPENWFCLERAQLSDHEVGLVAVSEGPDMGANLTQFRLLRRTPSGYQIILKVGGLGIDILKTKSNGLQDVASGIVTGMKSFDTNTYRFDGREYRLIRRQSEVRDAAVPRDLSKYETRAPLVQAATDNDSGPISELARAWIWERWKSQKFAYLKVSTHDENHNQKTVEYFITQNDDKDWELILKIHSATWRREEPSAPPRKIVDDDLWVASALERVDTTLDSWDEDAVHYGVKAPQKFPDDQNVAPADFRLCFLDGDSQIDAL
jgi:hypothetical protein